MFKIWIILGFLIIFLIGFRIGRQMGLQEGLKIGFDQAPLEIKRISLESGQCIICGITKKFQDIAG